MNDGAISPAVYIRPSGIGWNTMRTNGSGAWVTSWCTAVKRWLSPCSVVIDAAGHVIRKVTDLPPDQIVVAVTDTPPSWLMEAGMVLPETNHEAEAAWMKKLQERFPGKYDDDDE